MAGKERFRAGSSADVLHFSPRTPAFLLRYQMSNNNPQNLWGFIDNYDANGVPAGIVPPGSIPKIDKSHMTDEQKLSLAKVCAKGHAGYYYEMEKYKNATDPKERARLKESLDRKERVAMSRIEEAMKDVEKH